MKLFDRMIRQIDHWGRADSQGLKSKSERHKGDFGLVVRGWGWRIAQVLCGGGMPNFPVMDLGHKHHNPLHCTQSPLLLYDPPDYTFMQRYPDRAHMCRHTHMHWCMYVWVSKHTHTHTHTHRHTYAGSLEGRLGIECAQTPWLNRSGKPNTLRRTHMYQTHTQTPLPHTIQLPIPNPSSQAWLSYRELWWERVSEGGGSHSESSIPKSVVIGVGDGEQICVWGS